MRERLKALSPKALAGLFPKSPSPCSQNIGNGRNPCLYWVCGDFRALFPMFPRKMSNEGGARGSSATEATQHWQGHTGETAGKRWRFYRRYKTARTLRLSLSQQRSGPAKRGGTPSYRPHAGARTRVFFLLSARLRGVIFIPEWQGRGRAGMSGNCGGRRAARGSYSYEWRRRWCVLSACFGGRPGCTLHDVVSSFTTYGRIHPLAKVADYGCTRLPSFRTTLFPARLDHESPTDTI